MADIKELNTGRREGKRARRDGRYEELRKG
jgi:hypothetical protein